ncbi:hypothetical protein P5V15_001287 [Pogonomyrmex californicus]
MWRQRYIEFRLGQILQEMGEDAPHLELSSGERERPTSHYERPMRSSHAFLPSESSEMSKVHVDNSEKWHIELIANPTDTLHLLYTLTHEIGHALRLHYSPQKNTIMYAFRSIVRRRRYGEYGYRSTEKNGARNREDSGLYT